MKIDMVEKIAVPDGVRVDIDSGTLKVEANSNKLEQKFVYSNIMMEKADNNIVLSAKNASKKEKRMMGSFKAHIKNMLEGVKSEYIYKLMICSSHFPMSVAVEKNEIVVKNFFGEKIPRKLKLIDGVKVSIDGNVIKVSGHNKEKAGLMAGKIEKLTAITNRDKRIFQDGIYICEKAGKAIK